MNHPEQPQTHNYSAFPAVCHTEEAGRWTRESRGGGDSGANVSVDEKHNPDRLLQNYYETTHAGNHSELSNRSLWTFFLRKGRAMRNENCSLPIWPLSEAHRLGLHPDHSKSPKHSGYCGSLAGFLFSFTGTLGFPS